MVPMRIQDFSGVYDSRNDADIEAALAKRHGPNVNAFWLSHDNEKYPMILILAKAELASLHYFPKERHAGFSSVGGVKGLNAGGTTTFFMNSETEEHEVLNDSIVPFSTALTVAKEFSRSKELPTSAEWLE